MKEISAGGVVYRYVEDRLQLLMIEDRFGNWTLPKGKQEAGETLEATALREIWEETGIKGSIVARLATIHFQYLRPKREGYIDKEVHYFLVNVLSGKEKPQLEEINYLAWLSPDAAWDRQQRHGYDNNNQVLERALQLLSRNI